jgi:lipoprotein-anchoring transpeptidase ErfK/SrfK
MSGPRSLIIPCAAWALSACAAAPAAPAVVAELRNVSVQGPALPLDWDQLLAAFQGQPAHQRTLAAVEATVAEAYRWSEWREVAAISAPEPDDQGVLMVYVSAEPPAAAPPVPEALAWPPPERVPAPAAPAGARDERQLDAALYAWQHSPARVLIDNGERRLYLKRRDGGIVSFPVAVGTARTPTPPGDYTVEGVRENPTWYPPASIRRAHAAKGKPLPAVVPPGPGNPLGDWFVRLQNGIGIHGTNQPRLIGRAVSAGCVRMHDSDVAQVVAQLRPGDGVTVVRTRAALLATR